MSFDSNIYYTPEAFGLERVAEIEYSDRNYVFDTRMVWRQTATGRLLTARDSGCSCPSPFENHNLTTLESANLAALEAEFESERKRDSDWQRFDVDDARRELAKVRTILEFS